MKTYIQQIYSDIPAGETQKVTGKIEKSGKLKTIIIDEGMVDPVNEKYKIFINNKVIVDMTSPGYGGVSWIGKERYFYIENVNIDVNIKDEITFIRSNSLLHPHLSFLTMVIDHE